jgi:hypothetical protein
MTKNIFPQRSNRTENATDKTVLLRVWREGGSRFVVVDESKAG